VMYRLLSRCMACASGVGLEQLRCRVAAARQSMGLGLAALAQ
jgi:hypothetical protein